MSDIIGFIKAGNLAMIHGLIGYFRLGQATMLLRGSTEEFQYTKGPGVNRKVPMATWNPLLLAIAHKKLDVVRYFLYELKISLSAFGRAPDDSGEDARFAL